MEFFTNATALAALAVVIVQQVLKLKVIPGSFANKYPVPTNIVLSAGAAVVTVWQNTVERPDVWTEWVLLSATISVVAALVYNMTLHNWVELRKLEGTSKSNSVAKGSS